MNPRLCSVLACFVGVGCTTDPGQSADATGTTGLTGTESSADASQGDTSQGDASQGADAGLDSDPSSEDGSTADATSGGSTTDEATSGDASSTEGATTGVDSARALHVAVSGQNANPGTPDAPMQTIQWALAQAEADPEIDTVRVAAGDYDADVANDDSIVMVPGVSMLGGWNDDFTARDPEVWPTRLRDSSMLQPVNSSSGNPSAIVEVPAEVDSDTEFSGFQIAPGRGLYAASIVVEGSPVISHNLFDNGAATEPTQFVTALFIDDGEPLVTNNRIRLEQQGGVSRVTAVRVIGSDPLITTNVIVLTGGNTEGVDLSSASPRILGNSIVGGSIRPRTGSEPEIDNNLLQNSYCVADASSFPASLRNNLLQCDTLYWSSANGQFTSVHTLAELHGAPDASGNVVLPSELALDPADDLQLDATMPCTVTRGGLDLTAELPGDFGGHARTDPMSMGAHEWEGQCQ